MKPCDKIAKEAFHFWEGLVTEPERAEIAAHLKTCPGCDKRYAQAKEIHQTLHGLRKYKPSPHFNVVLHARLRLVENRRRRSIPLPLMGWSWQVPAYAAAALFLVAGGVVIDRVVDQRNLPQPVTLLQTAVSKVATETARKTAAPQKIQNYVMSPIPMEQLMRINHRYAANQRGVMERRSDDSIRIQDTAIQQRGTPQVRQVSAPVRF